jgi:hypothetical protein
MKASWLLSLSENLLREHSGKFGKERNATAIRSKKLENALYLPSRCLISRPQQIHDDRQRATPMRRNGRTEPCPSVARSADVLVRWRCFVVLGRRGLSASSERINVRIARARNQRHHHYRER